MTTININLLPEEMRGKQGGPSLPIAMGDMPPKEVLLPLVLSVVAGLAIAAAPSLYGTLVLDGREAQLAQDEESVKAEINKYNMTLNSLRAIGDNKEFLRRQLAALRTVAEKEASWSDKLNELRSLTPSNMWFDGVKANSDKNTLELTGGALDYTSVAFFQNNLMHSDYFENPVLSSTEMDTSGTSGVNVVKFSMTVELRKEKKS